MKYYFLMVSLVLASVTEAAAKQWQLQKDHNRLEFSVAIEGSPVSGEFTHLTADIIFDPEKLDQAHVAVRIDLNHITASYSDVAQNLKKKDWFDVENFPTAQFIGQDFKHLGGASYQVTGLLTLRDVTRSEVLFFTVTAYEENRAAITGQMQINRLNYGVGQGAWRDLSIVAGQVFLDVTVTATGK